MINLDKEEDYYILVDRQGGTFGGGRILESNEEVLEQFRGWAEADEMENHTLKGYSFGDLIEIWTINIMKYDGVEFRDLMEHELNEIV